MHATGIVEAGTVPSASPLPVRPRKLESPVRAPDPALCPGETVGAVTAAGFHSAYRIAEGGSARRRGERKWASIKRGEAGPRRKGPASHTLTLEIGGSA